MRPGVALYGVNPTPGKPNPIKPVVELKVRIAKIRDIAFGETVGYDATWTARRPSRIAIATMGYADGFPRLQSGNDQKPGGTPNPSSNAMSPKRTARSLFPIGPA